MSPDPAPDHDPALEVEARLRRAMHARWDRQPLPRDLTTPVQARYGRAAVWDRVRAAGGAVASLVLIVTLTVSFGAMLGNRPAASAPTLAPTPPPASPVPLLITSPAGPAPFTQPHPILGEVRVRQALAHCTDRPALVAAVYPWLAEPAALAAYGILPPGHWAYAPAADPAAEAYDPARGAALLEAAGWQLKPGAEFRTNAAGETLSLQLVTTDAEPRLLWGQVWEAQLRACGAQLVRLHAPASWFFGASTGLRRREFDLAAYAWVAEVFPIGRPLYGCDQAPTPANGWRGENFSGWCSPAAEAALARAEAGLTRTEQHAAYGALQDALRAEAPLLPLFFRPNLFAVDAALEGFDPGGSAGLYTWNAAQWRLPNQAGVVIGAAAEPPSLATAFNPAYLTQVLSLLINGADYTERGYDYLPLTLPRFPTLENGGAVRQEAHVTAGDRVVDADGQAQVLAPGVRVRTAAGEVAAYVSGSDLHLPALTVTYAFSTTLTWGDGHPVTSADYALGYRFQCTPAAPDPVCDKIARVDFVDDATYRVTYLPGYTAPDYFLPPIRRQPAHQPLSDGRPLAEAPVETWTDLPEVNERPLGIGPYVVAGWEKGQRLVLLANPHYFAGPVLTPRIEVRFLETPEQAVAALLAGEVEVLDTETLRTGAQAALVAAAARAGAAVRLVVSPSLIWEHVDFALWR